jgi:hypothetical protein
MIGIVRVDPRLWTTERHACAPARKEGGPNLGHFRAKARQSRRLMLLSNNATAEALEQIAEEFDAKAAAAETRLALKLLRTDIARSSKASAR